MTRTQVELVTNATILDVVNDGTEERLIRLTPESERKVYWLDVPEGSLAVGDIVEIAEEPGSLLVFSVWISLRGRDITVPHRLGTCCLRA